ncbi:hypothetical protein DIPPA_00179 [Diplonema papillatum]|nr:hypothetical protein DIPPA_17025 [Diplonema papillatum]KAJ9444856.1 hypothetical protein DIPPA_31247 [Diplonema papillatum]KAJ9446171.1 hypothetical protein DIPPA_23664 [Diplonema papillatum]KAJ9446849.1 hypothetical protein DIPPA_09854 [Diplonema papillatum]KAJ9448361.1 hypothetical protein DIPPA_27499 [Diplonema papillatum]
MNTAPASPLPSRERTNFTFPAALVEAFRRTFVAEPEDRRNYLTADMEAACSRLFGACDEQALARAKGVIADVLKVQYSEANKLSATQVVGVVMALHEKDPRSTAEAVANNSPVPVPTSSVPPPSLDVSQRLDQMMALLVGLADKVNRLEAQETAVPASRAPTRMEGLGLGVQITDGEKIAVVTDVGPDGASIVVLGTSVFEAVPHEQLARYWKLLSATGKDGQAGLDEAVNTEPRDCVPLALKEVALNGSTWMPYADQGPVFRDALVTELERRAPADIPGATAYGHVLELSAALIGDDPLEDVLERAGEMLEFWRVRSNQGYAAADAFAATLDEAPAMSQRLKKARAAAEKAAEKKTAKAKQAQPEARDGARRASFRGRAYGNRASGSRAPGNRHYGNHDGRPRSTSNGSRKSDSRK